MYTHHHQCKQNRMYLLFTRNTPTFTLFSHRTAHLFGGLIKLHSSLLWAHKCSLTAISPGQLCILPTTIHLITDF